MTEHPGRYVSRVTGVIDPPWAGHDWRVFGTGARLVTPEPAALAPALAVVDRELAAVDLAASRFREDSEISAVNRAGGRPVTVSALFLELLEVALTAARATGGAVDPTLGRTLSELGYDRTFRQLPADGPAPRVTVRRQVDWRVVQVDRATSSVRLPAGVELDLGATAKAHAADRAAAAAASATGAPLLLSLGGDLATAGPAPEEGWAVRIAEDSAAPTDADGPVVVVHSGGLATSSTTVRTWSRGGQALHHLLDPWTGQPTRGPWRTVTVAAPTCLEANIAATASVVLGGRAPAWLTARELPARLVPDTGEVLRTAGWPQEAS